MRANPTILEINTWTWLSGLSNELGRDVTLASVPADIWDGISANRFDAVWLMGVWQRSPAGIAAAFDEEPLIDTFRATLDDFSPADVVGSPYCVRDYVVDPQLGGPDALAVARTELASRGMRLILDWVPNHVAKDHAWARNHPQFFIRGDADDLANAPTEFVDVAGTVIANGRDPYFAPWRDVLQLNAFDAGLRQATIDTLTSVAGQCDGVRCDMAMLMLDDVFTRTWSSRAGEPLADPYWVAVIGAIRAVHPGFVFLAEAYWGLEGVLREQGFDYCYDKELYDAIEHRPGDVGRCLDADPTVQRGSVRFIENHDEPRAQTVFGDRHRCAAVTVLTQQGARLIYDGQSVGRRIRTPVQLDRDPVETPDKSLQEFYRRLLECLSDKVFHDGSWRLASLCGWPGSPAGVGLLAWEWSSDEGRWLIVVNLDDAEGAGMVATGWDDLAACEVELVDPIDGTTSYRRAGVDVAQDLFVHLPPWGFHVFRVDVTTTPAS